MELVPEQLLRHTAIIGASGSGKTVLAKQILEDAILKGYSCIAFDTQGDIAAMRLGGDNALGRYIGRKSRLWAIDENCAETPFALDRSRWARNAAASLGFADSESEAAIESCIRCFLIRDMAGLIRHRGYFAKHTQASLYCGTGKLNRIRRKLESLTLDKSRWTLPKLDVSSLLTSQRMNVVCAFNKPLTRQQAVLSFVAQATYDAMLANPGNGQLRTIIFIDEIAPFLPPVRKTPAKHALLMLARQARKYGVGIIIATQSPGDVDYKALANFSTIGLGKLIAPQDLDKVKRALESRGRDELTGMLPMQPTGQFYKLYGQQMDVVNTRWLHTQHRPLTIADVRRLEGMEK